MKTLYYKASHKQSYLKAAEYLEFPQEALLAPTILAVRDGKIVGAIGTYEAVDWNGESVAPLGGPFKVTVEGNPYFVGKRLLDVYEFELQRLGIKAMWFCIGKKLESWLSTARRNPNWVEMGEDTGAFWFRRDFEQTKKVG